MVLASHPPSKFFKHVIKLRAALRKTMVELQQARHTAATLFGALQEVLKFKAKMFHDHMKNSILPLAAPLCKMTGSCLSQTNPLQAPPAPLQALPAPFPSFAHLPLPFSSGTFGDDLQSVMGALLVGIACNSHCN